MPTKIDMVGKRVGRFQIMEFAGKNKNGGCLWKCLCDCGTIKIVDGGTLRTRPNQSCGCLNKELSAKRASVMFRTHGLNSTPVQHIHASMLQRCFNPNCRQYKNYGGRGIVPCEFIKASPANIVYLISDRPSKDLTLERIDNGIGYCCGQCEECFKHKWPKNIKWATRSEQNLNRRNSRFLWFLGEKKHIGQWSKDLGVSEKVIRRKAGLLGSEPEVGWSTEPHLESHN